MSVLGFLLCPIPAFADSAPERIHVTVVGARDDVVTQRLLAVGKQLPPDEVIVDQWDRRDPPPTGINFRLPQLSTPAAFVCTTTRCSLPLFTPEQLRTGFNKIKAESQAEAGDQ